MLSVDTVSVHYGRVQAVRDASFAVQEGEIVALLGANGAGKSSLLQAIVGLVRPSQGQVWWKGQRLDSLLTYRVTQAGVSLVPEGRQILSSMTVYDNLLLGAYCHHVGRLGDLLGPVASLRRQVSLREKLDTVYELFPVLRDRTTQAAGNLSGGEQQMLAIGRGLMASPDLLLLDEPSLGLAPLLVHEILDLLVRLRDRGLTILLVEQDAHAALRIADRGYIMETGRIVAEGSAKELLASAHMRRAYLGMV